MVKYYVVEVREIGGYGLDIPVIVEAESGQEAIAKVRLSFKEASFLLVSCAPLSPVKEVA